MNAAAKAVANTLQFEAKKNGLSQLQSGEWTLSLKVHANDVPAPLLTAPMGTRYQAVIVELGDDEMPVEQPKPADPHKLSRQAAMLCDETLFRGFLTNLGGVTVVTAKHAADVVRRECQVLSRSEFDTDPEAAARWRDLKASYEAWRIS